MLATYCAERGLDAASFGLAWNNGRRLDLSMPWNMLGVPVGVDLDLVEADVPQRGGAPSAAATPATATSTIRVALQLPNGSRFEIQAPTATPLGEIIAQCAERGQLPGCISAAELRLRSFDGCAVVYLRSKVVGAALSSTTLNSLGIRGAVSLRADYPRIAVPVAGVVAMEADDDAAPVASPDPLLPTVGSNATGGAATNTATIVPADAGVAASSGSGTSSAHAAASAARAALATLRAALWDSAAAPAVSTLLAVVDGVLTATPADTRRRSVRRANPRFASTVGDAPGAADVLCAAGFALTRVGDDEVFQLPVEAENPEVLMAVRRVLAEQAADLRCPLQPEPVVDVASRAKALANVANASAAAAASFNPFRPLVTRVGDDAPAVDVATSQSRSDSAATSSAAALMSPSHAARGRRDGAPAMPPPMSTAGGGAGIDAVRPIVVDLVDAVSWKSLTDAERRAALTRAACVAAQVERAPRSRRTRVILRPAAPPRAAPEAGANGSSLDDDEDMPGDDALKREYVRKAMARASEATGARGVTSAAHRELARLTGDDAAARVVTTAVFRVRFPDRSVAMAEFSPLVSTARYARNCSISVTACVLATPKHHPMSIFAGTPRCGYRLGAQSSISLCCSGAVLSVHDASAAAALAACRAGCANISWRDTRREHDSR